MLIRVDKEARLQSVALIVGVPGTGAGGKIGVDCSVR